MMSTFRYSCRGFAIDEYWVPAFEVRSGEIVRVGLPSSHRFPYGRLTELLTTCSREFFQVLGEVVFIEWPYPRSRLREIFHRERALEWFCRQSGLSAEAGRSWLERVDLCGDTPVSHLCGATPRRLLAIQAALARRASTIILDTAGLDPLGLQRVWQVLSDQIGDAAAICLTTMDEKYLPAKLLDAAVTVTERAPRALAS